MSKHEICPSCNGDVQKLGNDAHFRLDCDWDDLDTIDQAAQYPKLDLDPISVDTPLHVRSGDSVTFRYTVDDQYGIMRDPPYEPTITIWREDDQRLAERLPLHHPDVGVFTFCLAITAQTPTGGYRVVIHRG